MRARRRFLSFFGQRKLILQKLHERVDFARLQAGRASKARVGRVKAARNRVVADLGSVSETGDGPVLAFGTPQRPWEAWYRLWHTQASSWNTY